MSPVLSPIPRPVLPTPPTASNTELWEGAGDWPLVQGETGPGSNFSSHGPSPKTGALQEDIHCLPSLSALEGVPQEQDKPVCVSH